MEDISREFYDLQLSQANRIKIIKEKKTDVCLARETRGCLAFYSLKTVKLLLLFCRRINDINTVTVESVTCQRNSYTVIHCQGRLAYLT